MPGEFIFMLGFVPQLQPTAVFSRSG